MKSSLSSKDRYLGLGEKYKAALTRGFRILKDGASTPESESELATANIAARKYGWESASDAFTSLDAAPGLICWRDAKNGRRFPRFKSEIAHAAENGSVSNGVCKLPAAPALPEKILAASVKVARNIAAERELALQSFLAICNGSSLEETAKEAKLSSIELGTLIESLSRTASYGHQLLIEFLQLEVFTVSQLTSSCGGPVMPLDAELREFMLDHATYPNPRVYNNMTGSNFNDTRLGLMALGRALNCDGTFLHCVVAALTQGIIEISDFRRFVVLPGDEVD